MESPEITFGIRPTHTWDFLRSDWNTFFPSFSFLPLRLHRLVIGSRNDVGRRDSLAPTWVQGHACSGERASLFTHMNSFTYRHVLVIQLPGPGSFFLLSGDSFMGCQGDKWLGQWTVSAAATIWAGRNMPHCPTHCPYTECSLFLLRMTAVKATQPGTHELCFP